MNCYRLSQADDLQVMADGKRIDLVELVHSRVASLLPTRAQVISLQSRTFVPAPTNTNSHYTRRLGIRVRRPQNDRLESVLEDNRAFATGWLKHEPRHGTPGPRWTGDRTPMLANTILITIERAGKGWFWSERERDDDNAVALFA